MITSQFCLQKQRLSLVLSVCPVDWYGDYCSERCGANCNDCNKSNGICDFGCYAGWQGDLCKKGIKKFHLFAKINDCW